MTHNPIQLFIEHNHGPNNGFSELTGTVTDQTGAVIPGATVSLHQPEESTVANASTDAQGKFTMPTVTAGRYEVRISAPGFQTLSRPIEMQPRDFAQLTSTLTVGSMAETVAVRAEASNIQTEQSTSVNMMAPAKIGKLLVVSSVVNGDMKLAIDSAGTLFRSKNGKHWKKIKPQWQGKAAGISLFAESHDSADRATNAKSPLRSIEKEAIFQLTTSSDEVWVSADGKHWRRP